jgi:Family of unknown function (DUF5681)
MNNENLKPARKGEPSRNPAGRPVGSRNRASVLRKWLDVAAKIKNPETGQMEAGTIEDRIALGILTKALKGDPAAFREIMDSVYGKNTEKVETTAAVAVQTIKVRIVGGGPPIARDENGD